MFDRVVAYPDGVIEYHLKDIIVIEGKDLVPIIKRKYDKDLNGPIHRDNVVCGSFGKPSVN